MIFIYCKSKDPYFDLALEEYLLTKLPFGKSETIFMLWQTANTIVVGRNQNINLEINHAEVKAQKVNVVRRLSGGGAVYQDSGNINFTFIVPKEKLVKNISLYEFFTTPIILALHQLDVNASFSGKNDIVIDNKKISGNAQYQTLTHILHHGTLLFSENETKINQLLTPDLLKLKAKSIKSVKARVTNIAKYLKQPMSVSTFIEFLNSEITKNAKEVHLSPQLIEEVENLAKSKYRSNSWNYPQTFEATWSSKKYFDKVGLIEVLANVNGNKIDKIKFYGDFLGLQDPKKLETILENTNFNLNDISVKIHWAVKEGLDLTKIFGSNFKLENLESLFT